MEDDPVRVAVCFSGQLRTWKKCYKSWQDLFDKIKTKFGPNTEIDVFCHHWDFNTNPHAVTTRSTRLPIPVDNLESYYFRKIMQPKAYLIEDHDKCAFMMGELIIKNRRFKNEHGDCTIAWSGHQFYALMRSAFLKREYEIKHGFRYDVCIKMRYDLYFSDEQANLFVEQDLRLPELDTVYACHTGPSAIFPFIRAGDIFWFSDSVTFDKMADFYRWIPFIGDKPFGVPHHSILPEVVIYFYIKMLRLNLCALTVDPKVCRDGKYALLKEKKGLGGLGGHEIV